MRIVRTSKIPAVTAVNVAIQCQVCQAWLRGGPFWSIRKDAQLHDSSGCGGIYLLSPLLAEMLPVEPTFAS